ncbi:MAG: O-antigen polymerase [Mediterraneibacter faecis]|nr:O-antigen polymerase [Mediterraneibacter faecis]
MRKSLTRVRAGVLFLLILSIFLIMVIMFPEQIDARERNLYIAVIISYLICAMGYATAIVKKGFYILEPSFMISILYFMMFHFAPLYNIVNNSSDVWGTDVLDGGIYATCIFTIAYLLFLLCYYNQITFVFRSLTVDKKIDNYRSDSERLKVAWVVFIITYGIFLLNCIRSGMSLAYFFSFGRAKNDAEFNMFQAGGAFAVLNNLVYCTLPACLYIMVLSKRKLTKVGIFILTFIPIYLRGFRYLMIAMILMPITFYYVRRKKSPPLKYCLIGIVLIFIGITYVEITRVGISVGGGGVNVDASLFTFDRMWQSVQGNFDLYKSFYGAVLAFPEKHGFFCGEETFLATAYTMIPRAIWPDKPATPFVRTLNLSVGYMASISGWAAPNIYEYYMDFGTIGCVVCMMIFGCVWRNIFKKNAENGNSIDRIVKYSCIYPLSFQLVIRGYTPMNFYTIVFILIAIWAIEKIKVRE